MKHINTVVNQLHPFGMNAVPASCEMWITVYRYAASVYGCQVTL